MALRGFAKFVLLFLVMGMMPLAAMADDLPSRIKETMGEECILQSECGGLVYVDCGSMADGPAYYLKKDTLEKIMVCGGACMAPAQSLSGIQCTQCPPKEWTCKGN